MLEIVVLVIARLRGSRVDPAIAFAQITGVNQVPGVS